MEIVLSCADAALFKAISAELSSRGHDVESWNPEDPIPEGTELAIIEGLEGVVEAYEIPVHILALVTDEETTLFAECPRQVSDFVLKPLRPGEISTRVNLLASGPSWKKQTLDRLLGQAVERASDVIEISGPDGTLEYVNPSYEERLGIPAAEAVGRTAREMTRSATHPPEYFDEIDERLAVGLSWSGEIISRTPDERLLHFDTVITPLSDAKGHLSHFMAVKRDVTEKLKQREALLAANRALEEARDTALRASKAKSEFLANMSHELRTPLNAIIGYSELLMEDFEDQNDSVYDDLKRIRTSGTHLLTLINDVLDLSKIEADRIELQWETFAIGELLHLVGETAQLLAEQNHNQFVIEAEESIGAIYADRTRLRQVLLNLLSNACKFTENGTVTLAVRSEDRDEQDWLTFAVADTGIGITEAQAQRLFRPFVQADTSTTRQYGGTGLGLAISKRLVEMMGGTITLASEPGNGSVFTVRIPRGAESVESPSAADFDGAAPSILLIDDDAVVRDVFVRAMSARGFRVTTAASGTEGLELANRIEPDAIVLDVKMPGMSGWDVLSALKLGDRTAGIPVIMQTVLHQQEIGHALGAVDYVTKPIAPDLLQRTLRRCLYGQEDQGKVLVIEDDEPTRELIRRTLENSGHLVTLAENGAVGIAALERDRPHVVILDLMMPVMDGFTFLYEIRGRPEFRDLPVIVATARDLSAAERRTLETVAQRVIEKNAQSREELLDLIGEHIRAALALVRSAA